MAEINIIKHAYSPELGVVEETFLTREEKLGAYNLMVNYTTNPEYVPNVIYKNDSGLDIKVRLDYREGDVKILLLQNDEVKYISYGNSATVELDVPNGYDWMFIGNIVSGYILKG